MRIVFLNRFFWPDHSATSQMLSDLAFALAGSGHAVTVVASRLRYDDPAARLAPRETVGGVRIIRLWSTRFGRAGLVGRAIDYASFYGSVLFFLILRLRSGDLVVSKTDPPMLGLLAAVVSSARPLRRINWLQDLFPEVAHAAGIGVARGWAGLILRRIRDWSLAGATNVVIGERMAERLLANKVERIRIIPNWADGTSIRPLTAAANALRGEWGLSDKFVVGYSGNLGRVHESRALVEAAEHLRAYDSIVFLIIGGGKEGVKLRGEAERRGLANVQFRPYQSRDRLGHSLTLPDLHLISLRSVFEGLVVPSKFYGVAAAGRPCIFIGDADGEIGRILRDGSCGLTVGEGDGRNLADAILAMHEDRTLCERMGSAARQLFDAQFDKSIAMAKWERVLREAP